jgi:hypothetical protein
MKLLEMLRKGIGYVLMAMGASSSGALKKKPAVSSSPKSDPPRPPRTSV